MKIDFHVHTTEYSGCASSTLEEQVFSAMEKGIDVLFITDHMKLYPYDKLQVINDLYAPFKVYQGIEVTISADNYEDILVFGIHDTKIEKKHWSYPSLYKYVKSKGGIMILAHPYRFSDRIDNSIWDYPPDAVEVLSNNIDGGHGYERRKVLAKTLDVPCVTNSDSHHFTTVGHYVNEFPEWCKDEASIIEAVKKSDFKCSDLR